jgi:predicted GH43/DUF377 family glycosyl hydrolase
LFYRSVDREFISSIGYAAFDRNLKSIKRLDHPIVVPKYRWEQLGCEDPRITKIDSTYYMLYTAYSRTGPRVALAFGSDMTKFEKKGIIGPEVTDKDAALFPESINDSIAMIHRIESSIQIAYFNKAQFEAMHNHEGRHQYWSEYLRSLETNTIMKSVEPWEHRKIGLGPPPIKTPEGWLLIYHGVDDNLTYRVGVALADLDEPFKIVARSRTPILEPTEPYEKYGFVRMVVFPEASMVLDGLLYVFYGAADTVTCLATAPLDELLEWLVKRNQ